MKKILWILVMVSIGICTLETAVYAVTRSYEKGFSAPGINGYVRIAVSSKIVISITMEEGEARFSWPFEKIIQGYDDWYINPSNADHFKLEWDVPYDGKLSVTLYEGDVITGTMTRYPSEFRIENSFRITADIWEYNSYIDIESEEEWLEDHPTSELCAAETTYGEHSEQTELLRYIRDNILSKSQEGKELIKLYYLWSPVIVRAMEQDDDFKEDIKELVDGVLGMME